MTLAIEVAGFERRNVVADEAHAHPSLDPSQFQLPMPVAPGAEPLDLEAQEPERAFRMGDVLISDPHAWIIAPIGS